jgi:putative hydrolase of HD superfamily
MNQIVKSLGDNKASEKIKSLWQEYELDQTPEAKFVHEVDKLELAIQTMEYEHKYDIKLDDFFTSCAKRISNPQLLKIFDAVIARRPQ